jgi:hypothetical protein
MLDAKLRHSALRWIRTVAKKLIDLLNPQARPGHQESDRFHLSTGSKYRETSYGAAATSPASPIYLLAGAYDGGPNDTLISNVVGS